MRRRIKDILLDESGAMVIVEATFVFPIMFFVIFFLFFMGNMYFAKAYTDNLVTEVAIRTAAKCADPNLETIINSGNKVPDSTGSLKNEPYRYIFNSDVTFGNGSIEESKNSGVNLILNNENSFNTFFKGMEPQLNSNDINVKFNNNLVNYSLSITATYKISLPWKFLFSNEIDIYSFTSHAEVPVSDAPEFIRNIDMVIDYMQQSETVQKAKKEISKLFNKDSIKNLK